VREADNLPPYSADVKKSRNLSFPRPLWACMACNVCALPLLYISVTGIVGHAKYHLIQVTVCFAYSYSEEYKEGL
jgi:hypothetical protein